MSVLNTPVPLFKAPAVDQKGYFVAQVQNWLLNLYDKNKWGSFWLEASFPVTSVNLGCSAAPMAWDVTNVALSASPAASTSFGVILNLPNSWIQGSPVYPMIRWMPSTASAGNVLWGLTYRWSNQGETDPGTWSPIAVVGSASGALKHSLSQFPPIDGTGKTISSLLTIMVYRVGGDALDTYPDAALVKELSVAYESDTQGSRTALSK